MKTIIRCVVALVPFIAFSQSTENVNFERKASASITSKEVATLIPKKSKGRYGFVNQNAKFEISPQFNNVGFFSEECTLQNSPNESVRAFGTSNYASVLKNGKDYRIDRQGKIVYEFKPADLGRCTGEFKKQKFFGYSNNGIYGVVKLSSKSGVVKNFVIEPQYQLVHIMEGDDVENPLIVVAKNDKFGVVDRENNIIIPIIYADIKRNFSWKLAGLFEVTKDGNNYFYVDINNKKY